MSKIVRDFKIWVMVNTGLRYNHDKASIRQKQMNFEANTIYRLGFNPYLWGIMLKDTDKNESELLDEEFDENDKINENIYVHFQNSRYNNLQQFEMQG